jgi:hypothetical protein
LAKTSKNKFLFFKTLQNEAQAGDGFGSNGHKYVDRLSYFKELPKKWPKL